MRKLLIPVIFSLLFLIPVSAQAADLYVDTTGDNTANNCATQSSPCLTIQHAVDQAGSGDTVNIADGTYLEQVRVDSKDVSLKGESKAGTRIKMAPGSVYTPADLVNGVTWTLLRYMNSASGSVSDLTVTGPSNGCGSPLTVGSPAQLNYGILIEASSTVDLTNVDVLDVRDNPINGCQFGIGVRYRSASTGVVNDLKVSGYQKSGLIVSAAGSHAVVDGLTIEGTDNAPLAQNGIQISADAKIDLNDASIIDNDCGHASCGDDPWSQTTSTGMLLFDADEVNVSNSYFFNNDVAQYNYEVDSGATENSEFDNNTNAVFFSGGDTTLRNNRIHNSVRGVYIASYAGQPLPVTDKIYRNNIVGNTTGIRFQDDGAVFASADLSSNRIVGNAVGASAATAVSNEYDIEDNWWGCNEGPNSTGCDTAGTGTDADPWIILGLNTPGSGDEGASVPVSADLTRNSDNSVYYPDFPEVPVSFSSTQSTLQSSSVPVLNSLAPNNLTLGQEQNSPATVTASLDNAEVTNNITILPVLPSNTNPPAILRVNNELILSTSGVWSGSEPIAYTYIWQACDTSGSNCQDVPGSANTSPLPISVLGSGFDGRVQVRVQATNAAGSAFADSNQVAVSWLPPVNTTAPVIVRDGNELVLDSTGVWTGTPDINYSYIWQTCDTNGSNCQDLSGSEDEDTIRVSDLPTGFNGTVRVRVVATNPVGNDSAVSNSLQVAPPGAAPVNITKPVIAKSGSLYTVVSNGAWEGTEPMTFTYQWYRCDTAGGNCVAIQGATGDRFDASSLGRNFKGSIRVDVAATNSFGDAEVFSPGKKKYPLINTFRARVVPAVAGWSVFAQDGNWYGRPGIRITRRWQLCRGIVCKNLNKTGLNLKVVGQKWKGASVRLIVKAQNQDGVAYSVSKPLRISKRSLAVKRTGVCSPRGGIVRWRIGSAKQRIRVAQTGFGHKFIRPYRKTKNFYYYKQRMPAKKNTRRVARSVWTADNGFRTNTKTKAYLTCR